MGNQSSSWAPTCIDDDNGDYSDWCTQSTSVDNQLLWEYQRYIPGLGWSAGENFLTNDPGRYSSYDEKIYGETLQSVAPPIPHGYQVDQGWAIVYQRKVTKYKDNIGLVDETGISDKFGWIYSDAFHGHKWHREHLEGMHVRRRAWKRTLAKHEPDADNPL